MKYILVLLFLINLLQARGQNRTEGRIYYEVTFSNEFFSQSKRQLDNKNLKQKQINHLNKKKRSSSDISSEAVIAQFPKIQQESIFFKKDTLVYWLAPVHSPPDTINLPVFRKGESLEWYVLSKGRSKKTAYVKKKETSSTCKS